MKRILIAAFAAAVLSTGLQAQISGSINRNAPKVTTTITMGENTLELRYTSIRFGEGQWQKILENEAMHERFNEGAERRPLGEVKLSCAVKAAGKEVPAGTYKLYFTANKQAGWILNLKPAEGEAIRWRLVLTATDDKNDCMKMSLEPSAQDGQCSLTVAFGSQAVTVPVMVAEQG